MTDERTPLLPPGSPTSSAEECTVVPATPGEADDGHTISKTDFRWLMVGLWMMTFIASLDGTIVATLISTIGSAFQEMRLSGWIGTSYLLSVCCFTPLYGRLSDILGRRWSCMLAAGLFGGGTILCGCATSMRQLLLFRLIAGMGGGGIAVTNSIVVSDHVSLKDRGVYQGFTNLLFGLGAACGAPLGGFLSDRFGWRVAFLCQSPLLIGGMLLIFLKCKEPKSFLDSPISGWEKVKRIDYLGSLTLVGGIGSLLLAMSLKTTSRLPFSNPTIYGLLIMSGLSLTAFIAVESWVVQPVLPLGLLAHRTSGFVALNNLIIAILSFAVLYNVPLFFVTVLLRTSANAGSHLIPNSCMIMVGSLGAGAIMRKTGKYYWLEIVGACGILTSSIIFIFWDYNTPEWLLYLTMIPSGLGFSCVLTTTLVALLSSVPREQISVATGVSYLFRTTGQVLGVSLSATLLQALLEKNLRARIDDERVVLKILDSTKYILTLPADLQRQATDGWLASLRVIFVIILGLAILLIATLLPIEENPLPGSIEQEEADRKAAAARGDAEV